MYCKTPKNSEIGIYFLSVIEQVLLAQDARTTLLNAINRESGKDIVSVSFPSVNYYTGLSAIAFEKTVPNNPNPSVWSLFPVKSETSHPQATWYKPNPNTSAGKFMQAKFNKLPAVQLKRFIPGRIFCSETEFAVEFLHDHKMIKEMVTITEQEFENDFKPCFHA